MTTMNTSNCVDYAPQSADTARAERVGIVKNLIRESEQGMSTAVATTLYLAAVVSVALVFACHLIDSFSNASILAVLVLLWAGTFLAIATGVGLRRSMLRWRAAWAQRGTRKRPQADDVTEPCLAWADARAMAHVSRAMRRDVGRDVRGFH
jgi:hypothetical protein